MNMWPQYVYLGLVLFSFGFVVSKHGESRDPYNAWDALIGAGIALFLLYKGGFFNGL